VIAAVSPTIVRRPATIDPRGPSRQPECGTREFLPPDYPYLVEYDLVPTITEEPEAWWTPQRDEAHSWGRVLQSSVNSAFGEAQVTARLIDALDP
jgi:hypothetical protein